MSMGEVVVFTTLPAFCFFVGFIIGSRRGYKKGAEAGMKVVLKQWKSWINEEGEDENA